MNLKELRKEIERLQKNIRDCEAAEWSSLNYDIKIKGIKQTVEAVDKEFGKYIENYAQLEEWQKIKELLDIK